MTASTATETPAHMVRKEVTAAMKRKAADAGLNVDLYLDGLGRYHAGIVLIWKVGGSWRGISDTGEWHTSSLTRAFQLAARLNTERETMIAELTAMTDDQLQELVLDPTAEYMRVQYAMHTLYTARGHKRIKVLPR